MTVPTKRARRERARKRAVNDTLDAVSRACDRLMRMARITKNDTYVEGAIALAVACILIGQDNAPGLRAGINTMEAARAGR